MGQPSQYVDIDKFPPDERPHIIELAMKHNALSQDVDQISGATPEEKAEMWDLFKKARAVAHYLYQKRFNYTMGVAALYMGMGILKRLGINTEDFGPEALSLIKLLIAGN